MPQIKISLTLVKSLIIFVWIIAFSQTNCLAQLNGGLIGGVDFSKINDVNKIIISEPYFINGTTYQLDNNTVRGFKIGGFLDWQLSGKTSPTRSDIAQLDVKDDGVIFWYNELTYAGYGTELHFSNQMDFNYHMKFDYRYANILSLFELKYGISVLGFHTRVFGGLGAQYGLNVANRNILYTSGGPGYDPAFGTDTAQRQQLRNVLLGKSNFGLVAAAGFQFNRWFDIEGRFHYGLKNIVEVQPNSYNFVQYDNHNNFYEFVLKAYISDK